MPALDSLFEALKFDHLAAQCDALLEQAAKKDLGYRELLTQALTCEWQGRKQKGAEARPGPGPSAVAQDPGTVRLQLPAVDRPQGGARVEHPWLRRAGGKRRAARTAGRWQNASGHRACHQGRPGGPPGAVSDP